MRRVAILLLLAAAARGDDLRAALDAARTGDPKAAAEVIGKALEGVSREDAVDAIAPRHWPVRASCPTCGTRTPMSS